VDNPSPKILPNQIKAEKRENGTSQENIHILRTKPRIVSAYIRRPSEKSNAPPLLDPPNNIPAQSKCIRRIQQPFLCPLEHIPLINKIIQDFPALREEIVQPILRFLDERMLLQGVIFPREVRRGCAKWRFCVLWWV
jgi:hypothetical protein